jgi:primosomal protein N' (replication factor Y)
VYAEVAIPLPLANTFYYAVPSQWAEELRIGMRVIVRFQGADTEAYVVGLTETIPDAIRPKIKLISRITDPTPLFNEELLELCRWMASYYACGLGEALQTALPAPVRYKTQKVYAINEKAAAAAPKNGIYGDILRTLKEMGPLTERALQRRLRDPLVPQRLRELVSVGALEVHAQSVTRHAPITELRVTINRERICTTEEILHWQRRAPAQTAIYLTLLHSGEEMSATPLCRRHNTTHAALHALAEKGLVHLREVPVSRTPATEFTVPPRPATLTAEQQAAYERICEALAEKHAQTFLLHGVTGSGKTEVYLRAIEEVLGQGRTALVLVPEIGLTPQTVGRFAQRFPGRVAVLHSGLSDGERFDEWYRIQQQRASIVVGTRSAVFAPLRHLGIIIVDEEHDASYKQNEHPRYNARDVAIVRATRNKAVCVLGSATPSLESYRNSEIGKSVRLVLRSRVADRPLPKIHIVDMRKEPPQGNGEAVLLSRLLREAVEDRLARHEQVMLLLNRRGFAPSVMCPSCGWLATCEGCGVGMTYHRQNSILRCHFCHAQKPHPTCCSECGFRRLIFVGVGTQRAEDYLQRIFPNARLERMDADTTSGRGGHAKILSRFAQGEIDILVGTQMLAKGHDFPGVTLVGVLNADTTLAIPDFRSAEATFHLLTQAAGRAGRAETPGEVIVQTYRPQHYAIQNVVKGETDAFYAEEMTRRHKLGYPPFRRMLLFWVEHTEAEKTEQAAVVLTRFLRQFRENHKSWGLGLLGPAPALIPRINHVCRWQVAVLAQRPVHIQQVIEHVRNAFADTNETKGVTLKIDVDPYSLW